MSVLPIVGRELRVVTRRAATYWGRVSAALLALLLGLAVYFLSERSPLPVTALAMFRSLAWLALIFCLLAGVRLTADTISAERREGTLGLLFLTDLRGFDIVLGKLAAGSVNAVYSLLAILPVLAMPLLMGGVGLAQVWQVAVVLVVTLFFSLSVGMFVSCCCENGRRAAGGTVLILALVTLGPLVLLFHQVDSSRAGTPDFSVMVPSPLLVQALATTPAVTGKPDHLFWPGIVCILTLGTGFLFAACWLLPRVWRDRPRSIPDTARRRAAAQDGPGLPIGSDRFRRRLLDRNPFYWLAARDRRRPWLVTGVVAMLALLWLAASVRWDLWNDPGWHVLTSISLHAVLKAWVATAVVQQLAEERRTGSIELLLSTPLTLRTIVAGQFRALRRQFGPPLVAVLLFDLLLFKLALENAYDAGSELFLAGILHLAALGVDIAAIGLVGLWRALTARHASQAAGSAFFRIVVFPLVIVVAFAVLFEIVGRPPWERTLSPSRMIVGFYLLCLVNNAVWSLHAWTRLETGFREAATTRFEQRAGWDGWNWLRRAARRA